MALTLQGSNGIEHPSVQKVIKIAKEIIDENRALNTEILYTIAKRRLKIPRKGLLYIIQLLFNRKILVEGSKFTKESVLSNQLREKIYNFILRNLGAHFSLIRKEVLVDDKTDIGSAGQLIWHLEMLLKFSYIKKIKIGNFTVFLPIEIDDEIGIIRFLLSDEINKKIIDLLVEHDLIKKSEIYKLLNEKRELVYYRINNLIVHNIIYSEEDGKKLRLNPKSKEKINKILTDLTK